MANTIARLGVRLGIDSAEFSKGIEAAQKKLGEFAEKARTAGVVGVAAFSALAIKAMYYADALADIAKANDVAIGTVLKLGKALEANGGQADNASKLLTSFSNSVDEAAGGSFKAQEAFKKAGISLKDLGSLSTQQLLEKTAKGIADIEDPLTRNAKAAELFGKGIRGTDIVGFADDLAKTNPLIKEQERAIQKMADVMDYVEKATGKAMLTFTVAIGPALKGTIDYFTDATNSVSKFGSAIQTIIETVSVLGINISYVFEGIAREIAHTAENAKLIFTGQIAEAKRQNEQFDKDNEARKEKLLAAERAILGLGRRGYDDERIIKPSIVSGREVKEGTDPEAEKAKREAERIAREAEAERLRIQRFLIQQRQQEGKEIEANNRRIHEAYTSESMRQDTLAQSLKDEQERFELGLKLRHMRVEDAQLSQDLLEIEQRRNATIREIRLNTDLNLDAQNDLIDRENKLAIEAERFARARKDVATDMREASVGEGFNRAMEQYFINARTQMETGGQMFQAVIGNMEAALDRFARTGKLSFKDLARSIIQDMFAIHLKAQALQIFKGISSSYTAANLQKSLFEGSANYSGGFGGYAAEGGDISANKTYVVGERGPELFVPKSSGTVIPNNMLGSMGGNQPSVTYNGPYINNMSAIDTRTFEDYLYASNKAVWSANQYANKSLNISQGRA